MIEKRRYDVIGDRGHISPGGVSTTAGNLLPEPNLVDTADHRGAGYCGRGGLAHMEKQTRWVLGGQI